MKNSYEGQEVYDVLDVSISKKFIYLRIATQNSGVIEVTGIRIE